MTNPRDDLMALADRLRELVFRQGQIDWDALIKIEIDLRLAASRPAPVDREAVAWPESPIAIAQRGFEKWRAKEHNKKWFRKIDGTPIPNDVVVCIAQEFADTVGEPVATEADIAAIIEEQMLDAWNTICSDTDCHPLDIKQVGRRRLEFHSGHWSRQTAEFSAHRILQKLYTHPPKSPDTSAAVLQRVALEQALNSLAEIASSHIPDCPAHYAGEELAWAQRHVGCLRQKAEIARDGIAAAIRQLPTSKD